MKRRIRKTGEIIDVITSYEHLYERNEDDTVSYIDSKGNEHHEEKMNYWWDTEEIEKAENIDKRFELLKVVMPYFCALFNKMQIHNLKDLNNINTNECRNLYLTNFRDDFYIK